MDDASAAALAVLRQAAESLRGGVPVPPPLRAIMSTLTSEEKDAPPPAFFASRPWRLDERALFPLPDLGDAQARADADLRSAVDKTYASLPITNDRAIDHIYYLLQEYGWAVPSPNDDATSLFDWARTEAALAAAQVGLQSATRTEGPPTASVLIVGGDISGVQDFIYTLTAAGATKALRARSLYLQLLTDAIARWLLRQAGMPITNLLYSGGGRFYLVLPTSIEEKIDIWQAGLSTLLLHRHAGELYVALGTSRFDNSDLAQPQQFRTRWHQLGETINADKRRRFATLNVPTLANAIFAPQGLGGSERNACVVCRYQGIASEFKDFEPDREAGLSPEERRRICVLCDSFEDLATDARNAQFLILQNVAPRQPQQRRRGTAQDVLRDLGVNVSFVKDDQKLESAILAASATILSLTDPVPVALQQRFPQVVWGTRPLVNVTPLIRAEDVIDLKDRLDADDMRNLRQGQIKTFGMLVKQSRGIERLGVLRMDVDNLGELFQFSLQKINLARIGAFSTALSRFFEGWIGELCRQYNQNTGARVYAVYSGGDDLFIVGSWDVLPHLARRIREDLATYACNDLVHISAGISLHPAKFPLYQAAQAAGQELEQAKDRNGKNALAFLGQVIGWEYADEVFTLHEQLIALIDEQRWQQVGKRPPLSRAVLQVFQALYSEYQQPKRYRQRTAEQHGMFFGPWLWYGVYQLARLADERRNGTLEEQAAADWLDTIRGKLSEDATQPYGIGARFIERIGLAARWAQLELRKEER